MTPSNSPISQTTACADSRSGETTSVAVIINPIAGGVRPDLVPVRARTAMEAVERHGDRAEIFLTERPGHARQLAKAAASRGVRLVIAWGGDGTINEIASALAFGDVPLGIVPAGSGNGLARELGIEHDPARAIAAALGASPRPMDLGEIDDRLFVNIAGIGLDAHVAAQFNEPRNVARGFLAYVRITGRALFRYVPMRYRIVADAGSMDVRAILIGIANGAQYGNNARIAPGARLDDGMLDLVVVEEKSRLFTLRHVPKLFTGSAARMPGYSTARIARATIEAELPMTFHVDGEPVMGGTSLNVRVHPGALLIAAPLSATEAERARPL